MFFSHGGAGVEEAGVGASIVAGLRSVAAGVVLKVSILSSLLVFGVVVVGVLRRSHVAELCTRSDSLSLAVMELLHVSEALMEGDSIAVHHFLRVKMRLPEARSRGGIGHLNRPG